MPTFTILGFEGCGYYTAALKHLKDHKKTTGPTVEVVEHCYKRDHWPYILANLAALPHFPSKAKSHKTSPLIFKDYKYVGGHDDLVKLLSL